jgi:hypothetical protein
VKVVFRARETASAESVEQWRENHKTLMETWMQTESQDEPVL